MPEMQRWENDTFVLVFDDSGMVLYIVHGAFDEAGHAETERFVTHMGRRQIDPCVLLVHVMPAAPLVDRKNVKRWAAMMNASPSNVLVHLTAIPAPGLKGHSMRAVTRLFELLNAQKSAKKTVKNLLDECSWIATKIQQSREDHSLPDTATKIREWLENAWKCADMDANI